MLTKKSTANDMEDNKSYINMRPP